MNDLDNGFTFLMNENHIGIVYGVLKRLNIRMDNPQFEDLKQEGFIHLAIKYSQYNEEIDDDRVCGYLFQAVYWHLLDILRKQQRTNNHVMAMNGNDGGCVDDSFSPQEEIDGIDLLNQLWLRCTGNQRKFLCCAYNESMTITQIARKYHVSRKTVYQWKKGVQEEFYKLK